LYAQHKCQLAPKVSETDRFTLGMIVEKEKLVSY